MNNEIFYFNSEIDAPDKAADHSEEAKAFEFVYTAVASSTKAVPYNFSGKNVNFILDHSERSVDVERISEGIPILVDHDEKDIVGVTVDYALTNQQLFIDFKLSSTEKGKNEATMISEGIRKHMSVGAAIHHVKRDEKEDGSIVVTATQWEPVEVSLATIPRNHNARIVQSLSSNSSKEEIEKMSEIAKDDSSKPSKIDIDAGLEEIRLAEISRIRSLESLGNIHNASDKAKEYIAKGYSVPDFQEYILGRMAEESKGSLVRKVETDSADIGMSENEIKEFSWGRVVRALSFPTERSHVDAASYEREVSDAAAAKMGIQPKGYLIPNDVLRYSGGKRLRVPPHIVRMTGQAGQPGENAEWVATDTIGFIDNLRNNSALMSLNPRMLTGMVGNFKIRKKTGSSTAYWTAEGDSTTQSSILSGEVSFTPKRLTTMTAYDKQLLVQTDPSVDQIYRDDMSETTALELDRAALYGTGAANQPTGLVGQTGVTKGPDYTAPGPDWSEIVALETTIATQNALIEGLSYLVHPSGRGHLKSNPKFASGDTPIWGEGQMLNGYNAQVSTQVTATHYWFGNWRDLIIAQWGAYDLTSDPYTLSHQNEVRLIGMLYVDIGVRHGESFVYIDQAP